MYCHLLLLPLQYSHLLLDRHGRGGTAWDFFAKDTQGGWAGGTGGRAGIGWRRAWVGG